MILYAKVWYSDNDDDITDPFPLPDEYGADLLIHDMVGCGWWKIEIMNEAGEINHTITWLPNGEYELLCLKPVIMEKPSNSLMRDLGYEG
jgi:hypothetical protein